MSCPNVRLRSNHPENTGTRSTTRHPVSHTQWRQLLAQQLEESLDNGVVPLGEAVSRGALLRITLVVYDYTFVCKWTVRAFVKDLQRETAVYERLRPLQDVSVPMFLGSIDLWPTNKIYFYDHRVYIVYMLFMSWGGYKLHHCNPTDYVAGQLATKTLQSLLSTHREGIVRKDVRRNNLMFNPGLNRVMIIDFE